MRIVQVTDTHGDQVGVASAASAIASIGDYDLLIHTGDMVQGNWSDSTKYLDTLPKFVPVLGNHDMLSQAGVQQYSTRWDFQPTVQQAHDRYFQNVPKAVKISAHDTWWYADLPDGRVIGLDYTARGMAYYREWDWLEWILADAEKSNLPVLMVSHECGNKRTLIPNADFTSNYGREVFTDHSYPQIFDGLYPMMNKSYEIVCDHADSRGLRVIAWIYGHEHADIQMVSDNINVFPMIALGSTVHDSWNDTNRSKSTDYRTDAIVNLYEVSQEMKALTVFRIGAQTCGSGSLRDFVAWDYGAKDWVAREARGY